MHWLERIGARNRGYVRKLTISVKQPEHSWQFSDGSRGRFPSEALKEVLYPRSPYLHCATAEGGQWKEGEVQNINPALERVFELLGPKREGGSSVTVELKLDEHFLPGVEFGEESQCPWYHYFLLDLPNLIEKFRVDYFTNSGDRGGIEILWKAKTLRDEFKKNKNLIEKRGWDIVETKEEDWPQPWRVPPGYPPLKPIQYMHFKGRRNEREGSGALVAEDPSPYSHWGYVPEPVPRAERSEERVWKQTTLDSWLT